MFTVIFGFACTFTLDVLAFLLLFVMVQSYFNFRCLQNILCAIFEKPPKTDILCKV